MRDTHYAERRKYEDIDVIQDWNLSFNLGNALTYISRASRMEEYDILDDLRKAKECLDDEIDRVLRMEDDLK